MTEEHNYTPEEWERFQEEVARLRRAELPRVRDEEIKSAAQRAVAREIETERTIISEELDDQVERSTIETHATDRREANRTVPSQLWILLLLAVVLLLFIAATQPGGLRGFFGGSSAGTTNNTNTNAQGGQDVLEPLLGANAGANAGSGISGAQTQLIGRGGDPNAGGVDGINSIVGIDGALTDALFWPYYSERAGIRLCGLPLAPATTVNGRRVQWFERCRFEFWPEYGGSENEVQLGLLGREFTDNRMFPPQQFFTSRPELRFFPETSHAVGEPFLSFWEQNGGVRQFGYPISEVVQEEGEDGIIRSVQYFERVRMEEHSEQADPNNRVMLGLLGRALYLNEAKGKIIEPLRPTAVPLP